MAHQAVRAQVVGLVQDGHQEVARGDVAAHEHVAVTGVDYIYGLLGDVVSGRRVHHRIGLALQAELLEHGDRPRAVADQHGLHKALLLGRENALEHVLAVRAGEDDAHGPGHLGNSLEYLIEILKLHDHISVFHNGEANLTPSTIIYDAGAENKPELVQNHLK